MPQPRYGRFVAESGCRTPVPAGRPRVDSVSPDTPRVPVRFGPPVVLSGYVFDIDVSIRIAGGTAPESTAFEYSSRPPFVLHAATAANANSVAVTSHRRPPLCSIDMRDLLSWFAAALTGGSATASP